MYLHYPVLFPALAIVVIVPYDLIVLALTGAGPYSTSTLGWQAQVVIILSQQLLITPLVSALHAHAVDDVQAGRDPEFRSVARRGLRVLPVVVAATIMATLGIVAGLVVLIVPGVILLLRWYVVAQQAALQKGGWLDALRGSRLLTAGHYGHIIALAILAGLVAGLPGTILNAILNNEQTAATFLLGLLGHLYLASFGALASALLYFDLVSRKQSPSRS
jgi:hypothetical protein